MKIIIPVSNKYHYIMPVFCEMFNKYWPNQECIILCNNIVKEKVPDNFEILSIGPDKEHWTTNLREFFSKFSDEYFVFHIEDHILTDYVKIDKVKIMENEIKNGADKAMLHSHLNIYGKPLHDDVLLIDQNADYRLSIHTAIWRTEYFLKKLKYNRSIWGFEASPEAKNDGAKIVSLNSTNHYQDHIVDFMNLLRAGHVDKSITGLWHEEDLETLLKIPFKDQEDIDSLIRRSNNYCSVCNKKIDRFIIKTKPQMKAFEKNGICIPCQDGGK